MSHALAYGIHLLSQLPGLISTGIDVIDLINRGRAKMQQFEVEKRDPTSEEWDELNARIEILRDKLHR